VAFGHLAQLVARRPGVMAQVVEGIDLDLASAPPYSFEPTDVLLKLFDDNASHARRVLESAAMPISPPSGGCCTAGRWWIPAVARTCCETPSTISFTIAPS
jgi:hypothetical protein